jgi:Ca-activated chloride channel family protein
MKQMLIKLLRGPILALRCSTYSAYVSAPRTMLGPLATLAQHLRRRSARQLLLVLTALAVLTACGKKEAETVKVESSAPAFTVLATSDLKDAQELEGKVLQATGIPLKFTFGGTMESTEQVLTGATKADAAWFANAKYLLSDPAGQARVKLQEKIMLSPLVIGVSESDAKSLGWDAGSKVTWKTVTDAARTGKLRYAMSNPATSNQGFMAMMGVVAAASGKTEALVASDVNVPAIRDFLKGYTLVGDNSTYLAGKFIEQQGKEANAFINYENWLLSLNQSGKLKEPLRLIYPHEGVATADYPLMLLNDAKREQYQKIVAYLKGAEAQTWLARSTLRRPINQDVAKQVEDLFPKGQLLVELPFSTDRVLADRLIEAYLNEFRKPISSTFVIDVSGSMNDGTRRQDLIQALHYIAGADTSLTGRFAKLTSRERLWLMTFSNRVNEPEYFEVPAAKGGGASRLAETDSAEKQAVFAQVRAYADDLKMRGGTAMYDALYVALKAMGEEKQKRPDYAYSVVAFTDGENNTGRNLAKFRSDYLELPEAARKIPVFMILFGEARESELKSLVEITGGKVFDARKTPLATVFKDIRSYQ